MGKDEVYNPRVNVKRGAITGLTVTARAVKR